MQDRSFDADFRYKRTMVSNRMRFLLTKQPLGGRLREALIYAIESPGKRIRSVLALWCCELVCGKIDCNAEIAAAAIEMVHTYSLIHDDLPAMDNDDWRRGLPTCHKAFDEATAVLTGDALLTLAFEVLAKEVDDPRMAVKLVGQLSEAAGASGMIAGQMADLEAEGTQATEKLLRRIHTDKTAKMFRCAAAMGAICGRANDQQFDCLCEYGLKIGLGFQVADDILDVSASSGQLGKTAGKDEKAGKATYPAVVGMEKSRQLAEQFAQEAVMVLAPFGSEANLLRELAGALLARNR